MKDIFCLFYVGEILKGNPIHETEKPESFMSLHF